MNFWRKIQTDGAMLFLNCQEAARAQSEMLEHPLPAARRWGLALHLALCRWCRRYAKQIRFLRKAAHAHPERLAESTPQRLSSSARERMKRLLSEQK